MRFAEEREAEEPTTGFLRSLLRCAARDVLAAAEGDARDDAIAPMVEINRPHLSRDHVGLVCGHATARPLAKARPRRLRCSGCAEGRPTDREIVEAAIDEDLHTFAAQIKRRRVRLGQAP